MFTGIRNLNRIKCFLFVMQICNHMGNEENNKILLPSEESREGLMEGRLQNLISIAWSVVEGRVTIQDLEKHLSVLDEQQKRDDKK